MSIEPRPDLEQIRRSFAQHGYFVFRNVVSKEKLSDVRSKILDEYDRACRSGAFLSGGGRISGHLNCVPGEASRFAYDTLCQRGIIDIAKAIVPRAAGPVRVGCNLNLPGSVEQHYHADGLFRDSWSSRRRRHTIENGAIDVLPKHQKFYTALRGRTAVSQRHPPPSRKATSPSALTSGTASQPHSDAAPHARLHPRRNTLTEPRSLSRERRRRHLRSQLVDDDFLGRLRERTFVKAPFTYNAWRFVRSLYGNKGYAAW
jgi:hypothetical protein